jgi:hypothetical protein
MRQPICSILLVLLCLPAASGQSPQDQRDTARTLWEQAVAAKGGRERLDAIQSFAIQKRTAFSRWRLRDMATGKIEQIVCALPDAWWAFLDYRPGKMGYSVQTANARTGLGWSTFGGPPRPFLRPNTDLAYRMRQLQYVYFLETRAVRPLPIRASPARRGLAPVDRVETLVDDGLVVFDLDVKTHLPVRIETSRRITLPPPRPGMPPPGDMRYVYELDRYSEVSGIQVPGRVRLGGDPSDARVEINPDYDPSIFSTPPSPGATIESWRRRE